MNIEEKYLALSERDRMLHRPGMYIGSTVAEERKMYLLNLQMKFEERTVKYVPAMIKLVDEIISNSADEYRRKDNLGLKSIWVDIDTKIGLIKIWDDGGMPVVIHKEQGIYVPDMTFGFAGTSSNYDDTKKRDVVGTNGVGAFLTNVFSTEFSVTTADKHNKFIKVWSNNAETSDEPIISKSSEHFTEVKFKLDIERLNGQFDEDFCSIIMKKCVITAAANAGLTVVFVIDGEQYTFTYRSFYDYVIEHWSEVIDVNEILTDEKADFQFFVAPTLKNEHISVGIVNGAECNDGTHMLALTDRITWGIREHFKKLGRSESPSRRVILESCAAFVNVSVINPSYDSQSKDHLITEFVTKGFSDKFYSRLHASKISQYVEDWYIKKENFEANQTLRKVNREIDKTDGKIKKHIDANARSNKRNQCSLYLFEGDSASKGFRSSRDPQFQGCYTLRGKISNTVSASATKLANSEEVRNIAACLGLKIGQSFDINKLRYGKIVISTDMDPDGDNIAGQLIAFFATHYPEIIENGMLYRNISPVIVATKGKDIKLFYDLNTFEQSKDEMRTWKIRYIKGLGGLTNSEYKFMLQSPILKQFEFDSRTDFTIKAWFTGGSSNRKQFLEAMVK